jgi:hypothetical protein
MKWAKSGKCLKLMRLASYGIVKFEARRYRWELVICPYHEFDRRLLVLRPGIEPCFMSKDLNQDTIRGFICVVYYPTAGSAIDEPIQFVLLTCSCPKDGSFVPYWKRLELVRKHKKSISGWRFSNAAGRSASGAATECPSLIKQAHS